MNKKRLVVALWAGLTALISVAQKTQNNALENYFVNYHAAGQIIRSKSHLDSIRVNDSLKTVTVYANNAFGEQMFTKPSADFIYNDIRKLLPDSIQGYQLSVKTGGWPIEELIPNRLSDPVNQSRTWSDIDYKGKPWVMNVSRPYSITRGLQNRHFTIWASHGIYYDIPEDKWKWQRPPLFGTCEDLFTQTIVIPYLIPMLENAGAYIFTPRERDWQKNEVIIDNDSLAIGYLEQSIHTPWRTAPDPGFALHEGNYLDHENPFEAGTARMIETTEHKSHQGAAIYQPTIPEAGRYAVYVSYQTVDESIDDALYTVWHKGIATEFHVNQQMGGSTWVYLGTFDFDAGCNEQNRVVLSNYSSRAGIVTTDAVRFGGGMGNIERGGKLSGMPRCLEGSRYYAQWAGMPYEVYSTKEGQDDYGDDINARSYMTNLLGGGSCYMPDTTGRGVPIELSLAIHSDAGYTRDGKTNTGTLTICMTTFRDSTVNAGITRLASRDLADDLLVNIPYDIRRKYGKWQTRELYDRNYSECRVPEVPSAILEILSHQNFADMKMAQDPNFRFDLARSIYKTLLRYTARMHHTDYVIQPLAPDNISVTISDNGQAKINWTATEDPYEPTAVPTCYVLYTAKDDEDFDNGTFLNSDKTSAVIQLDPDKLYSFRVSAVNAGGESFPSEVVSALYNPTAQKQVLIVNGFHRLASPKVRDNASEQGFDLNEDIGVSYGLTAGWRGLQTSFDRSQIGKTSSKGLGFTNDSLAGQFIAGNDFNYIRTHASAIASARRYSIASCSSKAIESGRMTLEGYALVDLILGLEYNDGYSLVKYEAFPKTLRPHLIAHTSQGGALLVSGAYIGRDMTTEQDNAFLASLLKCNYGGTHNDYLERDSIQGLGTTFTYHRQPNGLHYAAQHPDVLLPISPAYPAMAYSNLQSACVAYNGNDYRALTIGFPFECIKSKQMQDVLMRGILMFLLQ